MFRYEEDGLGAPFSMSKVELTEMIDYWLALRRVIVNAEITSEYVEKIRLQLTKLDYTSDKPITLVIESNGGDPDSGLQLFDTIESLRSPLDTLVVGDCASAAVMIAQMGRKRQMLPGARMMVHHIRFSRRWIYETREQFMKDVDYLVKDAEEVSDKCFAIYQKSTGLSREKVLELFSQGERYNTFFSANQCIELKLADEVVTDFKLFPPKEEEPRP